MSNKRPLTAEELRMASRIKSAIAKIPGMTEDRVGAELGVSQGAVSHWTGGRLPVPVKRAAPLAALLHIADPGEISLAYREAVLAKAPATAHSQPLRLDPDMIAETHRALRELYQENGRVFSIEEEPARFVQVYQMRAGMSEEPSQDEWIKFGRKLVVLPPQGATQDGRSDGVPIKGTGAGDHPRRVRRKA